MPYECHINELINLLWGMWDMAVLLVCKTGTAVQVTEGHDHGLYCTAVFGAEYSWILTLQKGQHGTVGSRHTHKGAACRGHQILQHRTNPNH